MSESGCNLASINVETPFSDIFDFSLNFRIPFSKIMNSLPYFIKRNVALLPFWHLEHIQNSHNLSHLLVIFFNIVMWYAEILSDLFIHFTSNSIKIDGLRNYTSNVDQFIRLFFIHVIAFDLSWNSVNTLDHINHVLECVFNIVFEILFIGIKEEHIFDTDVEKTCFSLLFHFVK